MADTDRILWEEDPDPEAQPEAAPQAEPEAALEAEPLLRQPWADDPDETALLRPAWDDLPDETDAPPSRAAAGGRARLLAPGTAETLLAPLPPPRTLWPASTPGRKPRRTRCAAG